MENRQFTGEQKEFLEIIRKCRRRMNAAQTWEKLAVAVAVGAAFGLGFEAAAFILPLYYADLYALLAVALGAVTGLAVAYRQRVSETAAALKIDSFGFEERVVTAYEGLTQGKSSDWPQFFLLQQADAIRRLRAGRDRVRIAVCPPARKLAVCAALTAGLIALALVPSAMKERAKELHRIEAEAKEKLKEIETVTEKLKELETEELTEEQRAALQEMINSLASSAAEYEHASSARELAAAGQKLDYKYADMSSQLADLADSLQNGAAVSSPTASAMKEMSESLDALSGEQGEGGEQPGQPGDGEQNGDGQNGNDPSDGQNGNNQNGDSQSGNNQNGDGQDGQNGNNGEGGNQNGGDGGGQGDSQNGGDGDGQQGGGQNGGDGDGQPANGRGTGTAQIERDYISVPNNVGNDETLTGQAGNSDTSEAFKAQNGLSWEGDHVSYESVIGEYQQKAYEGLAGGKYPTGMEDVIKEYFGSFNE